MFRWLLSFFRMERSLSEEATQMMRQQVVREVEEVEAADDDEPDYWGRLYPARRTVRYHDLTKDEMIVGKLKSCDICLKEGEVPNKIWVVVSRQQFSIHRIPVDRFGTVTEKVLLRDLSMNGTFVNKVLVGKDKTVALEDKSIIAFGKPDYEVYHFKDAQSTLNFSRVPALVLEKYDLGVRIGTGAFGQVMLSFCKETGESFAMKTILKKKTTHVRKVASELQKLENEIKILRKVKHPNVIQLVDDIDCDSEKYLILELMEGGDLFQRITSNVRLTEYQSKLFFYQIASGVQYLHSIGIIHRDLKPENILLASEDDETLIKITDFGLSKEILSTTYLKSTCGTKMYAAPEVLLSHGRKKYTSQVDVWSVGVILFVCLSGETPFSHEKDGKTMDEQILEGDYSMSSDAWESVSKAAKRLVKRMITVNPTNRIAVPSLFDDPWLKDPKMLSAVTDLVRSASSQVNNVLVQSEYSETIPEQEQETIPQQDGSLDALPGTHHSSSDLESHSHSPYRKRLRVR